MPVYNRMTFNMADRGSYVCMYYGGKINGEINESMNHQSSTSEYSAICLWKMDTGLADICNPVVQFQI